MSQFWEVVVSNAVVASGLAIGVALLGRFWKNAAAVHLLWVLVLVKLFTPAVVSVPVAANWLRQTIHVADQVRVDGESRIFSTGEVQANGSVESNGLIDSESAKKPDSGSRIQEIGWIGQWAAKICTLSNVLLMVWGAGSMGIGVWYFVRVRRFKNYLRGTVEAAPAEIDEAARELARGLGLKRKLGVMMTSRSLPPLVWSVGRRARVILPAALFERLDDDGRRGILAHELAHVSRRDDLVRLLELAATTLFWWHPVVWWASRQMRELEDQCCDSRVVEQAPQQARTYAEALVDTLDFLSQEPRMLVSLPTAVQCSNSLSRRIQMLRGKRSNRLNLLSVVLVVALAAVPLAITFAAEGPEAGNAAASSAAVVSGRVTDEAGKPLADARIRVAYPATDMRFIDEHGYGRQQWETKTDADGKYRVELPGVTKPGKISVEALKPEYETTSGTLMRGGDDGEIDIAPGKVAEKSFKLHPALYFKGIVVDEMGKPISGVKVVANANTASASGGVEHLKNNADGTFEIFNYSIKPEAFENEPAKGAVHFYGPNYVTGKIDDVYALPKDQRASLRIVLPDGYKVSGTVVDAAGKPAPNLMIKAKNESDWQQRKTTLTDRQGKFSLHGLPQGAMTLSAHSTELDQKIKLPMTLDSDQNDLKVQLQPIALAVEPKKVVVLGMQLADLTPELRAAYDPLYEERGALVLDPGKDSERLGIGKLEKGDDFWMVGEKRIDGVKEFVKQLLAEAAVQNTDEPRIRVVYSMTRLDIDGTNTQYMKLTKEDLEQLRGVLNQLSEK